MNKCTHDQGNAKLLLTETLWDRFRFKICRGFLNTIIYFCKDRMFLWTVSFVVNSSSDRFTHLSFQKLFTRILIFPLICMLYHIFLQLLQQQLRIIHLVHSQNLPETFFCKIFFWKFWDRTKGMIPSSHHSHLIRAFSIPECYPLLSLMS